MNYITDIVFKYCTSLRYNQMLKVIDKNMLFYYDTESKNNNGNRTAFIGIDGDTDGEGIYNITSDDSLIFITLKNYNDYIRNSMGLFCLAKLPENITSQLYYYTDDGRKIYFKKVLKR